QELPVVSDVHYETKDEACARFKQIFSSQKALVENVDCGTLPASLRVKLDDPQQYAQVAAVLKGQPGIDRIVDQSGFLDRLFAGARRFLGGGLVPAHARAAH